MVSGALLRKVHAAPPKLLRLNYDLVCLSLHIEGFEDDLR
jgi:hypothetical protein